MGSSAMGGPRKSTLGDRMRIARQSMGWSTRTAAAGLRPEVSISHASLANYEKGATSPPVEVLSCLAALYGHPMKWFLEEGPVLAGIRYRNAKSKVGVRDRQRFAGEAQKWLDAYVAVETYLEQPLRPDLEFEVGPGEPPAEAAARLRAKLGLSEDDPVPSVVDVLERLGVRVIEQDTDLAIDGLAARLGDEDVVVLNRSVSNDRARMNAGHELGHVVRGDCGPGTEDRRDEKAAFELASHLLLTSQMLRAAFMHKSMVRLLKFKERFGISLAAMVYRAQDEDIISSTEARRLWIELGRRGWRKREPGRVRPDRAIRFETLLDGARVERDLSLSTFAKVAGVRPDELRRRLALAMGLEVDDDDDPPEGHTLRLVR